MIEVRFGCGHVAAVGEKDEGAVCPVCGDRRVQRVTAPAPRFRGVCHGPHATFEPLAGMPVTMGGGKDHA